MGVALGAAGLASITTNYIGLSGISPMRVRGKDNSAASLSGAGKRIFAAWDARERSRPAPVSRSGWNRREAFLLLFIVPGIFLDAATASGAGPRAIRRIGTGDAEFESESLAVMLKGEFGVDDLQLQRVNLAGSEVRCGQTIPKGLDLIFEIDDVRMQGMTHGPGEASPMTISKVNQRWAKMRNQSF